MTRPRLFLDSCVLIEGIVAPWSASRGVLILGRAALFTFVLAQAVLEEVDAVLRRQIGAQYGKADRAAEDLELLLSRIKIERIAAVTREEWLHAETLISHFNDIPILAAAIQAKPDWLITDNTAHFDIEVAKATGLVIVTPRQFLRYAGRIFPL